MSDCRAQITLIIIMACSHLRINDAVNHISVFGEKILKLRYFKCPKRRKLKTFKVFNVLMFFCLFVFIVCLFLGVFLQVRELDCLIFK